MSQPDRDEILTLRLSKAGKARLKAAAARGSSETSVSGLVRESLDALLLAADARGVPMRKVVEEVRAQHRDEVFNRPKVKA